MNFALYRLSKYVAVLTLLLTSSVSAAENDFSAWLENLRTEARVAGISDYTVNDAVSRIEFLPDVIALDRSQPEFISPFLDYYQKRVDKQKVQKGRQLLIEHEAMLNQIQARYGVSKFTLVAFWGLETQYGRSLGKLDILSSLATLAYDGRRTAFFRDQLLDALRMIDIGHVNAEDLTGSWAGAFGNMQFMPTTFMLYAVDGDGDNLIDVVDSLPDAIASAANYLSQIGWQVNEPAMLEVKLPDNFDWKTAQLSVRKPVEEWSKLGVRALQVNEVAPGFGSKIVLAKNARTQNAKSYPAKTKKPVMQKVNASAPQASDNTSVSTVSLDALGLKLKGPAAILLPQGYRGPAFMVFDNFDVIMDWNRSVNYALSVAQLAQQLRHDSRIVGGQFAEGGALSFQEMMDLQSILNARGFNAGEPDGLPGFMTQEAVRNYQLVNKLPADGYASRSLYQRLYSEQPQ
ncbi:MAG TPA: lytic murein transglycosylase [Methylotenera sp.]